MNPKLCKICGGVLLAATLGQFIACGYLVCRECGHPDIPTEKSFNTYMRDLVSHNNARVIYATSASHTGLAGHNFS